ncbi:uncharacterized protein LOC124114503 isoform X1 [Haliotis rufescens]|uniref:uncharacterized protein LOC124114503 isoform X1 n=1 Tax=Haliotis rufescens TaxID=6454 RepID=UPI00201F7C89|nr:uncharacterized protein LOC124114503 isoform X1 [Haliotis rufescens]
MDLFIPMCILCILTGHRIQGHNTATDGGVRFEKEQTDVGYALQEGQTAEDDWLQKAQTSTEHVLRHTRTNSTGVLSENETEAASNGTEHSATPLPTKPAPSAKNLQNFMLSVFALFTIIVLACLATMTACVIDVPQDISKASIKTNDTVLSLDWDLLARSQCIPVIGVNQDSDKQTLVGFN